MDLEMIRAFFAWSTVFHGALLVLAFVGTAAIPNLIHSVHGRWYDMPKSTYTLITYCFLGLQKLAFLAFGLVPYLALRLVG